MADQLADGTLMTGANTFNVIATDPTLPNGVTALDATWNYWGHTNGPQVPGGTTTNRGGKIGMD